MRLCYTLLCVLLLCSSATALTFEQPLEDPTQEARATTLFAQIRCMVCTSESIHESKTELAQNMRHLVRTKVTEGLSDTEIQAYLMDRYGYEILMSPPLVPLTYALWFGPLLMLLFGASVIWIFRKRQT